eukprot:TRINITY_DN9400_c0_g5_i1.p1 TRINITY_DN9400_c0_g5~~TRINITY_DN9400_c0_g5_i1.p1  ORF type:complete len:234 (+),score=33.12 TRINITY_DN9400_c0_g5_i1:168-869(+)
MASASNQDFFRLSAVPKVLGQLPQETLINSIAKDIKIIINNVEAHYRLFNIMTDNQDFSMDQQNSQIDDMDFPASKKYPVARNKSKGKDKESLIKGKQNIELSGLNRGRRGKTEWNYEDRKRAWNLLSYMPIAEVYEEMGRKICASVLKQWRLKVNRGYIIGDGHSRDYLPWPRLENMLKDWIVHARAKGKTVEVRTLVEKGRKWIRPLKKPLGFKLTREWIKSFLNINLIQL